MQTLTGNNLYAGTTTINAAGTLQVGNGGTTGSLGSGSVTNNATLAFDFSNDVSRARQQRYRQCYANQHGRRHQPRCRDRGELAGCQC